MTFISKKPIKGNIDNIGGWKQSEQYQYFKDTVVRMVNEKL